MIWVTLVPGVNLGYLPGFIVESDPRPCREQIAERYVYGGWRPQNGYTIKDGSTLHYPGDPPIHALAVSVLRDETLILFQHDLLAIIQRDGSFEVSRID